MSVAEIRVWRGAGEGLDVTVEYTLHKGTDRYNIEVEGKHVGWVCKRTVTEPGGSLLTGWDGYASQENFTGHRAVRGYSQRRWAVEEVLGFIAREAPFSGPLAAAIDRAAKQKEGAC